MDFIEHDLVRMADAEEAGNESKDGDYAEPNLIVPFFGHRLLHIFVCLGDAIFLPITIDQHSGFVLPRSLAQRCVRRRHVGGPPQDGRELVVWSAARRWHDGILEKGGKEIKIKCVEEGRRLSG